MWHVLRFSVFIITFTGPKLNRKVQGHDGWAYVDLLNIRYSGNIAFRSDELCGDRDECILSLSLQLLMENAVKHNSPQDGDTLLIEVARRGNMLTIRNNRIYKNGRNGQDIEPYGIGISNLKQRYWLECREQPEVVATRDAFVRISAAL